MKIIIVGGTGTIGEAVANELSNRHEVILASHSRGEIKVDINDIHSIEKMYQAVGQVDAVISTVGKVHFGALSDMTDTLYDIGIQSKLMGQVNLVLTGLRYINDAGSFTLTSGILNCDPIRGGSAAAMVNGGIDGFVVSAAIDMPRNIRINVVSPTVLAESMDKYQSYFRGFLPVPAAHVALAYSKSVEGAQTGQVYRVGY
jgi:NAD(P)-dependent dehydrogenase (short-subunit alcohol dehydrogenase family)